MKKLAVNDSIEAKIRRAFSNVHHCTYCGEPVVPEGRRWIQDTSHKLGARWAPMCTPCWAATSPDAKLEAFQLASDTYGWEWPEVRRALAAAIADEIVLQLQALRLDLQEQGKLFEIRPVPATVPPGTYFTEDGDTGRIPRITDEMIQALPVAHSPIIAARTRPPALPRRSKDLLP
jgi:hypothetical protein